MFRYFLHKELNGKKRCLIHKSTYIFPGSIRNAIETVMSSRGSKSVISEGGQDQYKETGSERPGSACPRIAASQFMDQAPVVNFAIQIPVREQ